MATIYCSSYRALEEFMFQLSSHRNLDAITHPSSVSLLEGQHCSNSIDFSLELLVLANKFGSTRLKNAYLDSSFRQLDKSIWNAIKLLQIGMDLSDCKVCIDTYRYIIDKSCIEIILNGGQSKVTRKEENELNSVLKRFFSLMF